MDKNMAHKNHDDEGTEFRNVLLPPKVFKNIKIRNIINSLLLRKFPGFDLITTEVLRELPQRQHVS